MSEDPNPSRLYLPRLRVPSLSFADLSHSGISNSLRNISSSTSLLSTPSNNIRRVQQIHGTVPKDVLARPRKTGPTIPKGNSSTTATRRLLNLQELKRSLAVVRPFVLRKPADLSEYDYSVYAHKVRPASESSDNENLPLIRESQIRAWESAEKVSANIIFDVEASTGDDMGIVEDYNTSMDITSSDDDVSFNSGYADGGRDRPIVRAIPDYTKGELKILLEYFNKLQSCDSKVDLFAYEKAEKSALNIYHEQQRIIHERAFKSNPKPLAKRKLQVFRKKELLHRLFGYSNNMNHTYITNNTAYSAFDNVLNATKALQEDNDDTNNLLQLEEEFVTLQRQLAEKIQADRRNPKREPFSSNNAYESMLEALDLLEMTNWWLTAAYESQAGAHDGIANEPDVNADILSYTMSYLKSCVREET